MIKSQKNLSINDNGKPCPRIGSEFRLSEVKKETKAKPIQVHEGESKKLTVSEGDFNLTQTGSLK